MSAASVQCGEAVLRGSGFIGHIHPLTGEVCPAWPLVLHESAAPWVARVRMLGRPHCTRTEPTPPPRPDWGLISVSILPCPSRASVIHLPSSF